MLRDCDPAAGGRNRRRQWHWPDRTCLRRQSEQCSKASVRTLGRAEQRRPAAERQCQQNPGSLAQKHGNQSAVSDPRPKAGGSSNLITQQIVVEGSWAQQNWPKRRQRPRKDQNAVVARRRRKISELSEPLITGPSNTPSASGHATGLHTA